MEDMRGPRLFHPLPLMLAGALGLLFMGIQGIRGRIEGMNARERVRLERAAREEAARLRALALSPAFGKDEEDLLRFRIEAGRRPVLDPGPAPPRVVPPFGNFRADPLLRAWRRSGDGRGLSDLRRRAADRGDALGLWVLARIAWKQGGKNRARDMLATYRRRPPPPGFEGPFLRLFLDLDLPPPPWAEDWLAGREEAEILALAPGIAAPLRERALLRARARSARRELEELDLQDRSLPAALPLRGGRELLLVRRDPKGGVAGLLVPAERIARMLRSALRRDRVRARLLVGEGSGGIPILPGLALLSEDPSDDPGGGMTLLYIGAAAVLFLGLGLAWRSLMRERRAALQREDFFRAATHELKTPLASLRLLLESLVEGRIKDPGKRDQYLRLMQGEAERLGALLGQALEFREARGGTPNLETRTLELQGFLEEIAALYAPQLERDGRSLELRTGEDLRAACDPDALRRILWNLLENARLHGSGTVGIEYGSSGGKDVVIDVVDQGPGIARKDRERVFTPFARGPRAGEGRAPGLGLGLAFARRLARAMGGDCRIPSDSEDARVRVSLPRAKEES